MFDPLLKGYSFGADGQQRLQSFYIGLHGSFGGKNFPVEELFDVCRRNLHSFYAQVKPDNLDEFAGNRDYMFYLTYDGSPLSRAAVDHIQPRSRLLELIGRQKNVTEEMIDSIAYLERNLIPDDESLWKTNNFRQFLRARAKLIADKINDSMR